MHQKAGKSDNDSSSGVFIKTALVSVSSLSFELFARSKCSEVHFSCLSRDYLLLSYHNHNDATLNKRTTDM